MKRYQIFTDAEAIEMTYLNSSILTSYLQSIREISGQDYIVKEWRYLIFFKRYTLFRRTNGNEFIAFNFARHLFDKPRKKVDFGILMAFFIGYEKAHYEIN